MAITAVRSGRRASTRPPGAEAESGEEKKPLDVQIPISGRPPHDLPVEEHAIEIQAENLPNTVITLALQINTRQGAPHAVAAIPGTVKQVESEKTAIMDSGVPQWEPFTPRARRWVLSALEEFFQMYPMWGEITLLKAGGLDHRLIARIKDEGDNSFRTGTIDDLFKTMNLAAQGKIKPDAFRNTRKAKPKGSQHAGSRSSRSTART